MDQVNETISRARNADEECKRILQADSSDLTKGLYRDLYFTEMLEGIQRLEVFTHLSQKSNYYLDNNNVLMASKQISKMCKKLHEEENFLKELDAYEYIKAQVEEARSNVTTSIEESIIQFLFFANETSLRHRIEKLYNLYLTDFETVTQENRHQRDIPNDFAFIIKSDLLKQYFNYVTNEYAISRITQVKITLELIASYEKEHKSNLIISGGMEKLMLNTSLYADTQNVSHLILLMYCYSNISDFKILNELNYRSEEHTSELQ